MIRYLTAGESHGEALIGIVEGVPAGVPLIDSDINTHLARRWLGFGRGGRAKFEKDLVHIYSGVRFSKTSGGPIALKLENEAFRRDRSGWPEVMAVDGTGEGIERVTLPRPGHADLVGIQKYGFDDIRPVIDRSSARETAMRVACCSIARQFLKTIRHRGWQPRRTDRESRVRKRRRLERQGRNTDRRRSGIHQHRCRCQRSAHA